MNDGDKYGRNTVLLFWTVSRPEFFTLKTRRTTRNVKKNENSKENRKKVLTRTIFFYQI